MDKKTLIATAIGSAVTLIVTMFIGWLVGAFTAGSSALNEKEIQRVVREVLITDKGETHAQALAKIDASLVRLSTQVEGVEKDVNDIRQAVRALASD